ncbi:MAG: peptide MFS transporter [Rikenellaceae bacterium]
MFKGQPKGLFIAAIANACERFGYYTMIAILTLFLMSKFGLDEVQSTAIYSFFTASIYILALVGGVIADRLRNYKGTITAGIIFMAVGYLALMLPFVNSQSFSIGALMVVAFGNGLFKGNLQALVGQLYDNQQYDKMRDRGFQIFYMFINIGATLAPFAATFVREWWLKSQGFIYNSDLSSLCHQAINGTMSSEVFDGRFTQLANQVTISGVADMSSFATEYLGAFNTGFHYAFGVSIFAMLLSLAVFVSNKKVLPTPQAAAAEKEQKVTMTKEEIAKDAKNIKQRLYALFAVFAVVIFFWFSFHQNATTLTFFARDYTNLTLFGKPISAEIFQSFNPFFVVFLTFIVVAIFNYLSQRGKEPSTPMKIAIGMGIAGLAFVVLAFGSIGLPSASDVTAQGGLSAAERVTPWLLIAVYFILTVAELFISPLGLSFVSKVAPKHLQGVMQGAWLGATAAGNGLLFIGAIMYKQISIATTWWVFAGVCAISMLIMLSMVKWLEKVTK